MTKDHFPRIEENIQMQFETWVNKSCWRKCRNTFPGRCTLQFYLQSAHQYSFIIMKYEYIIDTPPSRIYDIHI